MTNQQKSNIKILVRMRNLSDEHETKSSVTMDEQKKIITVLTDSQNVVQTKVDQVLSSQSTQTDVYQFITNQPINVLNGYNLAIFAYGQTGSGKTYTMFGNNLKSLLALDSQGLTNQHKEIGIVPRMLYSITQSTQNSQNKLNYTIFLSFLQIYNEKVYDLLQDSSKAKILKIHQSKEEGIFVEGLLQFKVNSFQQCLQLMLKGLKNRTVRETSMNLNSSRSHSLIQLHIQSNLQSGPVKSTLSLCDLAGSEKIKKTQLLKPEHLQEVKNINLSLTTLGKIIQMLSSDQKNQKLIPFRQSKLTRLLQNSLIGNSTTIIIGTISPLSQYAEQTVNTLKFVQRARHIVMIVKPVPMQKIAIEKTPKVTGALGNQMDYLKSLLQMKRKGMKPEQIQKKLRQLEHQNQELKRLLPKRQEMEKLKLQNRLMNKQLKNMKVNLNEEKKKVKQAEEYGPSVARQEEQQSSINLSGDQQPPMLATKDSFYKRKHNKNPLLWNMAGYDKKKNQQKHARYKYGRGSLIAAGAEIIQAKQQRKYRQKEKNQLLERLAKRQKQAQMIFEQQQIRRSQFDEQAYKGLQKMKLSHADQEKIKLQHIKDQLKKSQPKSVPKTYQKRSPSKFQSKIQQMQAKLFGF